MASQLRARFSGARVVSRRPDSGCTGAHGRTAARSHVRVHAAEMSPQSSGKGDTARVETPAISTFEVMKSAQTAPEKAPAKETNGAESTGNGSSSSEEKPARSMKRRKRQKAEHQAAEPSHTPLLMVTKPLPRVLILHTGGTLGMDPTMSYEAQDTGVNLKPGTGGVYAGAACKTGKWDTGLEAGTSGLRPGTLLNNVLNMVPDLAAFANLDLKVVYNKDSSNVGPPEWKKLAMVLHRYRKVYDGFLIIHGTDTMAYTASALSLMLTGFRKPIIVTGSQLPLAMPRSDARQNLIDSLTCLTAFFNPPHVQLQEVAVCFGGRLMRGNRCQKTHSSFYQAFDSLSYPYLANLGVDVDWKKKALLEVKGVYRPRFELDPRVMRLPIVPGADPRLLYGDLVGRGVRGVVLETYGVGNMPDTEKAGWLPWLRKQTRDGLSVYLASQCLQGPLQPELYRAGEAAMKMGVEAGPQMTPECAVIKMMQCLKYRDIPLGVPIAGEM